MLTKCTPCVFKIVCQKYAADNYILPEAFFKLLMHTFLLMSTPIIQKYANYYANFCKDAHFLCALYVIELTYGYQGIQSILECEVDPWTGAYIVTTTY